MNELQSYCFLCQQPHGLFGMCAGQQVPSWTPPPLPPNAVRLPPSQRMNAGLAAFLGKVWTSRAALNSDSQIYGMYNRVTQGSPLTNADVAEYMVYVNELRDLERATETKVSAQDYEEFTLEFLIQHAEACRAPAMGYTMPGNLLAKCRELSGVAAMAEVDACQWFPNDVLSTFFHFLPYAPVNCTQRVYVNTLGDETVKVMKFVVPSIVPGLPGVSEAKVAGPRGAGERADTIVIYSKSETTTNAVLERLTEYQRLSSENLARFGDETPNMTEKADNLRGVAVGAEPNWGRIEQGRIKQLLPQRMSFGSMRAKLIWNALDNIGRGTEDDFREAVIANFVAAKLNPMASHI